MRLKELTDGFCDKPVIRRDFKFRNQLLDSAAPAPRNIAEGFGRVYHPEFARFALIAKASEQEVLNRLIDTHKRRYITDAEFDQAITQCARR